MILRCTAKLHKLLGVQPATLVEAPSWERGGEWYGNLLWIDRRKCLLLTEPETLFSIFVADVRKADLSPVGPLVVELICRELEREGLPPETFGVLDSDDVVVAKTASRSVLGSMNDLALQCEWWAHGEGGLHRVDVAALNSQLRETPMRVSSTHGHFPLDAARTLAAHRSV